MAVVESYNREGQDYPHVEGEDCFFFEDGHFYELFAQGDGFGEFARVLLVVQVSVG